MRIEEALERFLVQLAADGRSPHTIGQYRRHVRALAHWARHVRPRRERIEGLDHEAVAAFLASRDATVRPDGGQKLASSTNCLRSSLKGFLAYMHRAGYTSRDPGRLIRRAQCSPPPPRSLSPPDQRRLLAVLRRAKGDEAERDHALFDLLLATGMRVGSAVALDLEDVDRGRGEVFLRSAKGNRRERVFLGRAIRAHLRSYIGKRTTGPLFPGRRGGRLTVRHVRRRFIAWLKAAGIAGSYSPHALRHSFAERVYRDTQDLFIVKEALRHRSIASTLVYARVSEERLRRALA